MWWPNSRYLMTDFVLPDGPSMDGLILLQHHHQGSYDSTDSGSLPPTYSRLPPDGHEFPEGESPSVFSTLIGRGPKGGMALIGRELHSDAGDSNHMP